MRFLSPARVAAAGLLALAITAAVLWLAPARSYYVFLPDPAHPLAPLVRVSGGGHARSDDSGGIYFVDVRVRKARLIERLLPGLSEGATLVRVSQLRPSCTSESQQQQVDRHEMILSQRIAAALALRRLHYRTTLRPAGVVIAALICDAPAASKLRTGDKIVGVDNTPVRSIADLRRVLAHRRAGARVRIRYRRGRNVGEVVVRTIRDLSDRNRTIIGFSPEQDLEVKLPVSIKIETRGVGGPSAGLAFALDLVEALGQDIDRGYKVAATGELRPDGSVAAIGAVKQKTIGARRAHVDVFLVPAGENAREARQYAHGLRIIPVETFPQALHALATLPPRSRKTA